MIDNSNEILFVYVTVPNRVEATDISKQLVEDKLAACVNIMENVDSVYIWDGEVVEESECVLIAKTHRKKLAQLKNKIVMMHSYDCPCIAVFGSEDMNSDFMKWMIEQLEINK